MRLIVVYIRKALISVISKQRNKFKKIGHKSHEDSTQVNSHFYHSTRSFCRHYSNHKRGETTQDKANQQSTQQEDMLKMMGAHDG